MGIRSIGNVAKRRTLRGGITIAAAGALAAVLAGTGLAATGTALASTTPAKAARLAPLAARAAGGYQFVTLGSRRDRTFNQLLGINNEGRIAAYFGAGVPHHPNRGYSLFAPYSQSNIRSENFPHAVQTQVTGLNDRGVQVGFYSTKNSSNPGNDPNYGWYYKGGFHKVVYPTHDNQKPPVDQLLGVNNRGIAVGFYLNGAGNARGYTYNIRTHKFAMVTKPHSPGGVNAPSLTAAAINSAGDVAGFYNILGQSTVYGFLKLIDGRFIRLKVPVKGVTMTQAFGVNDFDTVVGTYTMANGDTHGFIYHIGGGYTLNVDDPNGIGTTFLNGINNAGDIVGFYTDSKGNTDGLLAYPPF